MQVLPEFENLFSVTGYLGEAPQLSSTYAEYDNGYYVFVKGIPQGFYQNFAGTSLNTSAFAVVGWLERVIDVPEPIVRVGIDTDVAINM